MTFLATLAGFGLAMVLMAFGVLAGRRRIEHGCGEACKCMDRAGVDRGAGL